MRYRTNQVHPDLPATFARKSGRRVHFIIPRDRREGVRKELGANIDTGGNLWIGIGKVKRVMHIIARVYHEIEAEKKAADPQLAIIKSVIDFATLVEADGTDADPRHPDGGFMFSVRNGNDTDSCLRVRVNLGNSTVFVSYGAMFSKGERAYRIRITDEQRRELIRVKQKIGAMGNVVSGKVGGVHQKVYLTS